MCSPFVRKEANRFNWMIKGKLIDISWNDTDVEKTYHSYFNRLWGNNENYIHEDGFEDAYAMRKQDVYDIEIEKIAGLGYD